MSRRTSAYVATYAELAARIRELPARAGATRIVVIDGPAGAGKTRFAARLAQAIDASTIQLDDLCHGWNGLPDAAPRLVRSVLSPLAAGASARYRRYDWDRATEGEWCEVPQLPNLIIEGVTSGSRAVVPYLSFLIWVTAPLDVRIARGVARDGEAYRSRWERWSREEETIFAAERTYGRADLKVDGAPSIPHDPEREFVVVDQGSAAR